MRELSSANVRLIDETGHVATGMALDIMQSAPIAGFAAKTGGGDPSGNPRLADAISGAKRLSVPADNIDRAVKRGSGDLGDAAKYEEIMYEAYGQGGVAILVE